MKLTLILFFTVLSIVLGLRVFSSRQELIDAMNNAAFHERISDDLRRELARVNRAFAEKERILGEVEQSIAELESKVPLEKLERYIPKKSWDEIKPIVDRLKEFQRQRNE